MKNTEIDAYVASLQFALEDAYERLTADLARHQMSGPPLRINELDVRCWQQARAWDDPRADATTADWKIIAPEQVVIVVSDLTSTAVVYHGGAFSYEVERVNDAFWSAVREQRLPRGNRASSARAVYGDREADAEDDDDGGK